MSSPLSRIQEVGSTPSNVKTQVPKNGTTLCTSASSRNGTEELSACQPKTLELCKGKNIFLTGASSGLGEMFAIQLAHYEPSKIILSGRNEENLMKVSKKCKEVVAKTNSNCSIHSISCDLSDSEAVKNLGIKALDICSPGNVDILINNGGISSRSSFLDTSIDVDSLLMQVNFLSGAALAKIIVPGMIKKGKGTILWISSVQGLVGIPNRTSYAASKFAVQGYCEALRAELASSGVDVHVASPGYIRTNLSQSAVKGDGSLYGKMDATTANGADPKYVATCVLDDVAKGKTDIIVAASISARAAIWLRFLAPTLLQKMLVKRFNKS